ALALLVDAREIRAAVVAPGLLVQIAGLFVQARGLHLILAHARAALIEATEVEAALARVEGGLAVLRLELARLLVELGRLLLVLLERPVLVQVSGAVTPLRAAALAGDGVELERLEAVPLDADPAGVRVGGRGAGVVEAGLARLAEEDDA